MDYINLRRRTFSNLLPLRLDFTIFEYNMSQYIKKFGTAPVFFTAISTILGAVMFLRFGFAVGQIGLLGTFAIILIGHAVTIPTAMAIAEIATNQKVEGGGEYYIISRSFGLVVGSSIGIALYFSQAVSVAFYIIAFAEAFSSLFEYLIQAYGNQLQPWVVWLLQQKQTVSIPALFLLTGMMLYKGAELGVKALYVVVFTLFLALIAFFVGQTEYSQMHTLDPFASIQNLSPDHADSTELFTTDTISSPVITEQQTPIPTENNIPAALGFFTVFAIIFPAFTGMTAGVGLSGDLKNPSRSIPLGTLAGTLTGMVVYFLIAYKMAVSASPIDLANTDDLVMAKIAWQGWWLIPLGLAAATISSALGSLMVAPRTLQAIARDNILPSAGINNWLSKGKGASDEPYNATVITILIALVFVTIGQLDFVAEIISMFFMVTYGALCLISFLQHFAADPSYRPTFKSRWYISLFGAVACIVLIFFMNALYALIAIFGIGLFYFLVSYYNPEKNNLALIFQGAIFQLSRQLQVFLQKSEKEQTVSWRPSVICISENSFERFAAFDLLRWISQKYGFGTYLHKITGYLSRATNQEAREAKARLIKMAETSNSKIYIDTLVSPSYTSAIAQAIQLPGISGTDNNLLLFEYSKYKPSYLENMIDNLGLVRSVDFDVVVLGSSERGYGFKKEIHIWISSSDYENANLMILLGYIIIGHNDWKDSYIKIFAIYPEESLEEERGNLFALIKDGQLPISQNNIEFIPRKGNTEPRAVINEKSQDADLIILGFRGETIKQRGIDVFDGYEKLGNTLFVNAAEKVIIK